MITQLKDLPDGVLGFEARGEVTGDDYSEVMVPAIESALDQHDKIRLLYVLGQDFEDYSPHAAWDDAKVGMEHFFHYERIAVVTDHHAYGIAVKGFGFLMPAKVKVFDTRELGAAKIWISEDR